MLRKKLIALVVAMSLVMGILSACGGGSTSTTAAAPEAPAASAAETTGAEVNAEVSHAETRAPKIVLSASTDMVNMGPWVSRGPSYNIIGPMIYETLGAYDTIGGDFYGILMKDWEQVDEKTFRVTLYDYIFDSEGNQIKADDVVYSCETCWEIGELAETAVIDKVTAVDDYTVEFVWTTAPGIGGFEVVMSNIYIASKAAYEAHGEMITEPVGTGPYVLKNHVDGSSIVVEARDDYWQEPDLCKVPTQFSNVQEVEVQIISESSQITMALQTGAIDINNSVENEDLPQFEDGGQYGDKYDIYFHPASSGTSIMANCSSDSPLSDENLHRAVFYAIDTDGVRAFVNGGDNVPLAAFGGVTYSDYNSKWEENNFPYDLDLAKEYLAKSAYPDGTTLKLNLIQGNVFTEEASLAIQEYLAEIGITVEINTYPIAQYLPLEGDSTAWDLGLSGFANSSNFIVNSWSKYFDKNTIGRDVTKNFIDDAQLQSLMDTVLTIDGHTEENLDAFMSYVQEKAYMKGLFNCNEPIVFNSELIKEIKLDQYGYVAPGAFTYNAD